MERVIPSWPLDASLLTWEGPPGVRHSGSFCFMAHNPALEAALQSRHHRAGLALKVFSARTNGGGEVVRTLHWEGVPVDETIKVQNLFARYGLAPRVYDLVWVGDGLLAQVTDYLTPQSSDAMRWSERIGLMDLMIETHRIGSRKTVGRDNEAQKWDLAFDVNWIDGKFVDFGGYYFREPEAYQARIARQARAMIATDHKGEIGETAYQAVGALGVAGSRDTAARIAAMRLEQEDFTGKTVLDLGCNLGEFCRYTHDRGAARVIGVDRSFVAGNTRELDNWLGYWQTDYYGVRLPEYRDQIQARSGIERFDVVFCLSVTNHIGGYRRWITKLCQGALYFEGHGNEPREAYEAMLQREFESVTFLGYATDSMTRALFRCERGRG